MIGPDGWTMPVCEVPQQVGDTYRWEWAPEPGTDGEPFGFTSVLLESEPPHREVSTEQMIGMEGDPSTNELTLTARPDGTTLLSLVITYPNTESRDAVLDTGMVDGMEASYARLENVALG